MKLYLRMRNQSMRFITRLREILEESASRRDAKKRNRALLQSVAHLDTTNKVVKGYEPIIEVADGVAVFPHLIVSTFLESYYDSGDYHIIHFKVDVRGIPFVSPRIAIVTPDDTWETMICVKHDVSLTAFRF